MSVHNIVEGIKEKSDSSGDINQILFTEWSREIIDFCEIILGLLIVVIFILTPLVIALEEIYINIPITRDVFDNIKGGNSRVARIAEFTLRDAVEAVERAAVGEYGCNPNMAYCMIKVKSVTVIGFILAMIVQGASVLAGITYGLVGKAIISLLELLPS